MSNFSDIAEGIAKVIEDYVTSTKPAAKAYAYPPASINHLPAILIVPDGTDLSVAFGGNSFYPRFRLVVLVALASDENGWQQLYEMVDPTSVNKSVIKALRDAPTLNGKADTSEVISSENVGNRQYGGGQYVGFDLILQAAKSVA